jgi:hypothetical protein
VQTGLTIVTAAGVGVITDVSVTIGVYITAGVNITADVGVITGVDITADVGIIAGVDVTAGVGVITDVGIITDVGTDAVTGASGFGMSDGAFSYTGGVVGAGFSSLSVSFTALGSTVAAAASIGILASSATDAVVSKSVRT